VRQREARVSCPRFLFSVDGIVVYSKGVSLSATMFCEHALDKLVRDFLRCGSPAFAEDCVLRQKLVFERGGRDELN